MRRSALLPLVALLTWFSTSAGAQPRGEPEPGPGPTPHRPTHADSTRTLYGAHQVWLHGGIGWINAPSDVRKRYNAGLDAGVSGDRRFQNRFALRGRVEFHDFPSTQPDVVYQNGIAYPVNADYGHGWLAAGLAGGAFRVWSHFWFDGAYGGGYFDTGYSSLTYTDISTGQVLAVHPEAGWGPIWSAGVRYEFQPSLRDRLLAEVQVYSMDRAGTTLRAIAIRLGYRGI